MADTKQAVAARSKSSSNSTIVGITSRLLIIAAKLYEREFITCEEKTIFKQIIIQGGGQIDIIDFSDDDYLHRLVELISTIHVKRCEKVFNFLYAQCTLHEAKTISKHERNVTHNHDNSFVYGEIDFNSFASILRECRPVIKSRGGSFYDIGSGTGRPVMAASLLYDFESLIGIELLHGLTDEANKVLCRYTDKFKARKENSGFKAGVNQKIRFIQGDILKVDWSNGDVIMANSTCFGTSLMSSISQCAERLRPGAIVITLTKALTSSAFEVLSRKKYQMSWGDATCYVHRRLPHSTSTSSGAPSSLSSTSAAVISSSLQASSSSVGDVSSGSSSDATDTSDSSSSRSRSRPLSSSAASTNNNDGDDDEAEL